MPLGLGMAAGFAAQLAPKVGTGFALVSPLTAMAPVLLGGLPCLLFLGRDPATGDDFEEAAADQAAEPKV